MFPRSNLCSRRGELRDIAADLRTISAAAHSPAAAAHIARAAAMASAAAELLTGALKHPIDAPMEQPAIDRDAMMDCYQFGTVGS